MHIVLEFFSSGKYHHLTTYKHNKKGKIEMLYVNVDGHLKIDLHMKYALPKFANFGQNFTEIF